MDARNFFYDFGKAIYHIDAIYDSFAKQSGISANVLWILYALNDGYVHSQKEICLDWALPKSTVNTICMDMKEKGLIAFEPIKGKKREMSMSLTEKGKEYAIRVLKKLYEIEQNVYSQLSPEDIKILDSVSRLENLLKQEAV